MKRGLLALLLLAIVSFSVFACAKAPVEKDNFLTRIKGEIPADAEVHITVVWGNDEAHALAENITRWMKKNGYENVHDIVERQYAQTVFNNNIVKNSPTDYEIVIGHKKG